MELEIFLAEKYSLDNTKKWKIIDRFGRLALLDGFYQGTILDLDDEHYEGWYPFTVKEITDRTALQDLSNKTLYTFPDGIICKIWTYRGERLCSTKTKINHPTILVDETLPGYYIVSQEGLSLTYRKPLSGTFRLLDQTTLPSVDINDAIQWLGSDEKTSDGEMIYAVDENTTTIYKPLSKKWRESIVYSKSYPDNILFGMEIKEDLLERWIDLSSSAKLSDEEYSNFWVTMVPGSLSSSHEKLINTYSCFLSALYIGNITIYEDWYSVEFPQVFVPQFATEPGQNLNNLVTYIWHLMQTDVNNKILARLKRTINNAIIDPKEAYLELFTVDGLTGYEINSLRRL